MGAGGIPSGQPFQDARALAQPEGSPYDTQPVASGPAPGVGLNADGGPVGLPPSAPAQAMPPGGGVSQGPPAMLPFQPPKTMPVPTFGETAQIADMITGRILQQIGPPPPPLTQNDRYRMTMIAMASPQTFNVLSAYRNKLDADYNAAHTAAVREGWQRAFELQTAQANAQHWNMDAAQKYADFQAHIGRNAIDEARLASQNALDQALAAEHQANVRKIDADLTHRQTQDDLFRAAAERAGLLPPRGMAGPPGSLGNVAQPVQAPTNLGGGTVEMLVRQEAERQGVDPNLAASLARAESKFNPNARSPKGALGVMQLMPDTAQGLQVDPTDTRQNIAGGVTYLKQMLDRYQGNVPMAVAAYNAGPGNVDKAGGVPNFPETQTYVRRVQQFAPGSFGQTAQTVPAHPNGLPPGARLVMSSDGKMTYTLTGATPAQAQKNKAVEKSEQELRNSAATVLKQLDGVDRLVDKYWAPGEHATGNEGILAGAWIRSKNDAALMKQQYLTIPNLKRDNKLAKLEYLQSKIVPLIKAAAGGTAGLRITNTEFERIGSQFAHPETLTRQELKGYLAAVRADMRDVLAGRIQAQDNSQAGTVPGEVGPATARAGQPTSSVVGSVEDEMAQLKASLGLED